jgi:hypothetical protein
MRRSAITFIVALSAAASIVAQQTARTRAPRLWTDLALAGWALPIAGVKATPKFYTEAEYYTARVDELRTYPMYLKDREPGGYRDWMRAQGPKPLIEIDQEPNRCRMDRRGAGDFRRHGPAGEPHRRSARPRVG